MIVVFATIFLTLICPHSDMDHSIHSHLVPPTGGKANNIDY